MYDQVINNITQDGPIGLLQVVFNVTNATIDDSFVMYMENITRAMLKFSLLSTAEKTIFQQLCPNYTDKPHAAVE
jgi:hypothetical protein